MLKIILSFAQGGRKLRISIPPGEPALCIFGDHYIQTKTHSVQILYPDHGVYADGGSSALLSSRDQIDSDTICGICPYRPQLTANASNLPNTAFCKNAPRWFQTAPVFLWDGGRALTMDSYTICQYHPEALIVPISSGQELEAGNIFQRNHEVDKSKLTRNPTIDKKDATLVSYSQYLDFLRKIWGKLNFVRFCIFRNFMFILIFFEEKLEWIIFRA